MDVKYNESESQGFLRNTETQNAIQHVRSMFSHLKQNDPESYADILESLEFLESEATCDLVEVDSDEDDIQIPEGAWGVESACVTSKEKSFFVQTINPANYSIKFAPEVRPIKGTFDVCCIALKWNNNPGVDLNRVGRMGKAVASTYDRLSNGLVKLNITAKKVAVDLPRSARNLPRAESIAKRRVDAEKKTEGNYDFYLIVNNRAKSRSNAGGNTAHLLNTLTLTANHELGHLKPFKLQHSSILGGKSSGDTYSFMSSYGSNLAAPQLYNCGWLPNKVAQYEIGSPAVEFPMEYLFTESPTEGFVKAVRIPGNNMAKDMYVSVVQRNGNNVFVLHQSYGVNNNDGSSNDGGGGSLRVNVFGNQLKFRELIFTKVITEGNKAVIKISTDPTYVKPTGPSAPKPPTP